MMISRQARMLRRGCSRTRALDIMRSLLVMASTGLTWAVGWEAGPGGELMSGLIKI